MKCQLCRSYCSVGDHFHALDEKAVHLCGYVLSLRWYQATFWTGKVMLATRGANVLGFAKLRRPLNPSSRPLPGSTRSISSLRLVSNFALIYLTRDSTRKKPNDFRVLCRLSPGNSSTRDNTFIPWIPPRFTTAKKSANTVGTIALFP